MSEADPKLRAEPSAAVTALSHDGRGIARVRGKTVFIEDALPGEMVRYRILKKHSDYDEAQVTEVLEASPERVTPRCQHFGVCGRVIGQLTFEPAQTERYQYQ